MQAVQVVDPVAVVKFVPLEHQVQSFVRPWAVVYFPVGQAVHTVFPVVMLYLPGLQFTQAVNPVVGV